MKRPEKQLPSKANFSHFFQLNCSNFRLKQFERPYVKEFKFEWVWVELESKSGFQRQSVTKYLRLTLVFSRVKQQLAYRLMSF